jgi:hypothetical protein
MNLRTEGPPGLSVHFNYKEATMYDEAIEWWKPQPDEQLEEGCILTAFEWIYVRVAIVLISIAPIQLYLFFHLMISRDMDVIAAFPTAALLIWSIPSALVWIVFARLAAGHKVYYNKIRATLSITGFFLFSFHGGVLMLTRIIFVVIVRITTGDRSFRLNRPYILWDTGKGPNN